MEVVKDRVALITGATNKIGEAICLRLAKGGAKIAVTDTDQAKVDGLVSKIKDNGGEAIGLVADPTKADEVKKVTSDVLGKYAKIDILVNNVDDSMDKGIADLSDDDWEQVFKNNVDTVFLFSREVIPKMREKQYGRVINVGSLDYLGWPGKSGYSAAKSAVFGFTRSLALEMARDDITINSLAVSDMADPGLSEEEVAKLTECIPAQRMGKPEDVANAVGFFSSDTSKYLTGQTLFVCGGKSMHFSMSV